MALNAPEDAVVLLPPRDVDGPGAGRRRDAWRTRLHEGAGALVRPATAPPNFITADEGEQRLRALVRRRRSSSGSVALKDKCDPDNVFALNAEHPAERRVGRARLVAACGRQRLRTFSQATTSSGTMTTTVMMTGHMRRTLVRRESRV